MVSGASSSKRYHHGPRRTHGLVRHLGIVMSSSWRQLGRFSPRVRGALGLGVVLLLLSFALAACGEAQTPGPSTSSAGLGAASESTQLEHPEITTTIGITTTTTLPAVATEPSGPSKGTGQSLGEADVETAGLMLQNQFFPALLQGDLERLRSMLVAERRGEADALLKDAQAHVESAGPEAVSGGSFRPLVWTGEMYAWDPPLPVPSGLDKWIKEHPENRLGLQVITGDNVLWWFGMERSASGNWLVLPGPRDEEYRSTHTLAGLQSLVLEATPRSGVHVEFRLRQIPDSASVTADLFIENMSDSAFFLRASDLGLVVDGVAPQPLIMIHSPAALEIGPGETVRPGNGWVWGLDKPTSTSTRLSYTPSDPESEKRTWVAQAPEP